MAAQKYDKWNKWQLKAWSNEVYRYWSPVKPTNRRIAYQRVAIHAKKKIIIDSIVTTRADVEKKEYWESKNSDVIVIMSKKHKNLFFCCVISFQGTRNVLQRSCSVCLCTVSDLQQDEDMPFITVAITKNSRKSSVILFCNLSQKQAGNSIFIRSASS